MMKFILNRTDERTTRSVGRIVLYAFVFWIATRILMMVLVGVCTMFYILKAGLNPRDAVTFLGDPAVMAAKSGWWALPTVLLAAPLFEECAFRLGLSFRRWHVAVGLGALLAFFVSRFAAMQGAAHPVWWSLPAGALLAAILYGCTTDAFWLSKREKWLRPMMWCSAVLFAAVHLFAMEGLTWVLLPYALLLCLLLFFSGCVCVYLRVNLGFWWGFGAHVLNNVPALLFLLPALMK